MPGKFEGEPAYVEEYYALANEGMADDNYINEYDNQVDIFNLNPGDPSYSELSPHSHLAIWEDDYGFVYHRLFLSRESLGEWLEAQGALD